MKNLSEIDRVLAVPVALEVAPAFPKRANQRPRGGHKDSKHNGRFEVLNAFVDGSLAQCTKAEAAVWLVLYRDTKGGTAKTGQTWIAKRAGVNARTVRSALTKLKRRGLVDVVKRGGPSAGLAVYRVSGTPKKGGGYAL